MIKQILIINFLLFNSFLNSQITLTRSNSYPDIGDINTYIRGNIDLIDLSLTGTSLEWDLSSSIYQSQFQISQLAPSNTANFMDFPTSNIAGVGPFGNGYSIASFESISDLGAISELQEDFLSNPKDQMRFPFTYLDTFEDTFEGTILEIFPNLFYNVVGTINVQADATGELILPYATIPNTLRVKTIESYTSTLDGQATEHNTTTYKWYDGNTHTFLAAYTIYEPDSTDPFEDLIYLSENNYNTIIEQSTKSSPLVIFPNPATDQIEIESSIIFQRYAIYDITGSLVHYGQLDTHKKIDIQSIDNGVYTVLLSSENTTQSMKFIKQ